MHGSVAAADGACNQVSGGEMQSRLLRNGRITFYRGSQQLHLGPRISFRPSDLQEAYDAILANPGDSKIAIVVDRKQQISAAEAARLPIGVLLSGDVNSYMGLTPEGKRRTNSIFRADLKRIYTKSDDLVHAQAWLGSTPRGLLEGTCRGAVSPPSDKLLKYTDDVGEAALNILLNSAEVVEQRHIAEANERALKAKYAEQRRRTSEARKRAFHSLGLLLHDLAGDGATPPASKPD
jgi:hypothetical protein